jgi:hypothetical protein
MWPQPDDRPNSCWPQSLAAITGWDVDLIPCGEGVSPQVWRRTPVGPLEIDVINHWVELLEHNGYEMYVSETPPDGIPYLQPVLLHNGFRVLDAHVFAVDSDGTIVDTAWGRSMIDGQNIDEVKETTCNLDFAPVIVVREKKWNSTSST